MSSLYRPTYVEVNLDHLISNYDYFSQSSLGQHFVCPMIKANAYGHGDIQIAEALEAKGCQRFGVGLVEEGVRLREKASSQAEILVFGFDGQEAIREMMRHCLTPVVSDWKQLKELAGLVKKEFYIHLKINTGMNRLGFQPNDLLDVFNFIKDTKTIRVLGFGTHLMSSNDLMDPTGASIRQLELFSSSVKTHKVSSLLLHSYNTTGALQALSNSDLENKYRFGLRPGIGLFGYGAENDDLERALRPVMTLKSKIISTQNIKKGDVVSYGGLWKAPQDSLIGIVPIGYADGIPTQLSNQGCVVARGEKVSIVGRVCMDYTLIDVTGFAGPLGEEVEFFGEQLSPHLVAKQADTIIYDIFTRISERVPRVFKCKELG